jgi:hypothetical protein
MPKEEVYQPEPALPPGAIAPPMQPRSAASANNDMYSEGRTFDAVMRPIQRGELKFNPTAFDRWLADLPETGNVEYRGIEPPPIESEDGWAKADAMLRPAEEYLAGQEKAQKEKEEIPLPQARPHQGKVPKTKAEWDEFNRMMDYFAAYGRR